MVKLTNKQMSSIYGGALWLCTYKLAGMHVCPEDDGQLLPIGNSVVIEAASAVEAADMVHAQTGAIQVNCTLN